MGAGQHRVAVADHFVIGLFAQRGFDFVGDPTLVARHTRDVDESGGELTRVGVKVQHN